MGTRPAQNQISFHERIQIHENVNGIVNIDIAKSTVHELYLADNAQINIMPISETQNIPSESFMTMTIIVFQHPTEAKTLEFLTEVKWAYGVRVPISDIPDTMSMISVFSRDGGATWNAYASGNEYQVVV